jgi:hypothetical protein
MLLVLEPCISESLLKAPVHDATAAIWVDQDHLRRVVPPLLGMEEVRQRLKGQGRFTCLSVTRCRQVDAGSIEQFPTGQR